MNAEWSSEGISYFLFIMKVFLWLLGSAKGLRFISRSYVRCICYLISLSVRKHSAARFSMLVVINVGATMSLNTQHEWLEIWHLGESKSFLFLVCHNNRAYTRILHRLLCIVCTHAILTGLTFSSPFSTKAVNLLHETHFVIAKYWKKTQLCNYPVDKSINSIVIVLCDLRSLPSIKGIHAHFLWV